MRTNKLYVLLGILIICLGIGSLSFSRDMRKSGGIRNLFTISRSSSDAENDINQEESIKMDNVNNINLKVSSTDMNVIFEDRDDCFAHFYGKYTSSNKGTPELSYDKAGDTLSIYIDYPKGPAIYKNINTKLDVYLPSEYKGALKSKSISGNINTDYKNLLLKNIIIETSSGNIKTSNIKSANEVFISSTSGDFTSNTINAEQSVTVKTSSGTVKFNDVKSSSNVITTSISGNIQLDNIKCAGSNINTSSGRIILGDFHSNSDVNIGSISGDISINKLICDYIKLKTSSGRIKLGEFTGKSEISSISGDIEVKIVQLVDNQQFSSSSGKVVLSIPDNSDFKLNTKNSSGDISIDDLTLKLSTNLDNEVIGISNAGTHDVYIKTISGDIQINGY